MIANNAVMPGKRIKWRAAISEFSEGRAECNRREFLVSEKEPWSHIGRGRNLNVYNGFGRADPLYSTVSAAVPQIKLPHDLTLL